MFSRLNYHTHNSFRRQLMSLTLLLIISGILSGLAISAIHIAKGFHFENRVGVYNPVPGIVFGLIYGYTQFVGRRKIIFAVVSTLIYLLTILIFFSVSASLLGLGYLDDLSYGNMLLVCGDMSTDILTVCTIFRSIISSNTILSNFGPSSIVAGGLGGFLLSAMVLLLMKRRQYTSLIIMTIVGAAAGFCFVVLYISARWGDVFPVALLPLAYTLGQVPVGLTLKLTTTKDKSLG